jgi:dephospho-CoA kinase
LKIIGLCGGSGSGKGYVSEIFKKHGIAVIDTDAVYQELISYKSDCVSELAHEFGDGILKQDGSLSKQLLREIVFSENSPNKLSMLNSITHKHILSYVRKKIEEYASVSKTAVIIDAPLLFESGFNLECDFIISVIAEKDVRIKRIIYRDKISYELAKRRIELQRDDEFLKSNSDFIIDNSGDYIYAEAQVEKILKTIL